LSSCVLCLPPPLCRRRPPGFAASHSVCAGRLALQGCIPHPIILHSTLAPHSPP